MPYYDLSWFDLLQSVAIILGLAFNSASLSLDARTRKAQLHHSLSESHREIWQQIIENPTLHRISKKNLPKALKPQLHEEQFVLLVLNHLFTLYQSSRYRLFPIWAGLEEDIRQFFQLPLPQIILKKHLPIQEPKFRKYLERILFL